jgi:hypothetical protein
MDEKEMLENKIKLLYPNEPVKLLVEGGMSYAFEVENKIVRIARNEFAKQDYYKEEKILQHLQNVIKTVEVPNMKVIEVPFFHTIHKKLDGLFWNGNVYNKKTEKEKDSLANDCALFFAELHSVNVSNINLELPEIRPIQQDVESYLSNYLSTKEIDKILQHIEVLYNLQDKLLIHNDFYPPNFFIDDNYRLKCVFDFARACYCNYNFEFRKILSYEEGEHILFERIVKFYEQITSRKIDVEIIKIIDIYNYMDFLSYFAKNFKIEKGKIRVLNRWNDHIIYIKKKIRDLQWI